MKAESRLISLAAGGSDPKLFDIHHFAALQVFLQIDAAAFFPCGVSFIVVHHDADNPAGNKNVISRSHRTMKSGHGSYQFTDVRMCKSFTVICCFLFPSFIKSLIMKNPDDRRYEKGQRQNGYHGDPDRDSCSKAIEVIPAALFLPDDDNHDIVKNCISENRDQRIECFPKSDTLLADKKAESKNREYRA